MEKFIEVYDDLILPEFQDSIEKTSLLSLDWRYTPNIATPSPSEFSPGFCHYFIRDYKSNPKGNNSYFSFFNNVLYSLTYKKNILIKNIIHGRLFLHLPSPSPSLDVIHVDENIPHWVCLYYVTDSDGDTVFFNEDRKTEIQRITPKKGRIVFFDGSIPHCSTRPVKNTRVIINFDFDGLILKK